MPSQTPWLAVCIVYGGHSKVSSVINIHGLTIPIGYSLGYSVPTTHYIYANYTLTNFYPSCYNNDKHFSLSHSF